MMSFHRACALAAVGCMVLFPSPLRAESITITKGTVSAQTWDEMGGSFWEPIQLIILTTRSGLGTRFYRPGEAADLSNHIQLPELELLGAFDGPGAIDFRFTTGRTVRLPTTPVPEYIDSPYYLTYTVPFEFSGEVLGYAGDGSVAFARDLRGWGTSVFIFHGVTTSWADREGYYLTDTRFTFSAAQPVPEPATIFMLVAGLAGVLVRTRYCRTVQ